MHRIFIRPITFASALAALFLSACATTPEVASTRMPFGSRPATPPAGLLAFCERLPAKCATHSPPHAEKIHFSRPQVRSTAFDWNAVFAEPGAASQGQDELGETVILTTQQWALIDKVNRTVNGSLRSRTDQQAFGSADYWALPLTEGLKPEGNCKHFVLEKREALIRAGVSPAAMTMAVALTPTGETHAVLVLATDRGDFVLDNLNSWITPWHETGYTWIERQLPGDLRRWVSSAGLQVPVLSNKAS